ncbi:MULTISPECIES: DUF4187 domain-containing protein [Halomicrobium]|uniref:Uncharacterized protein n=2 Tax=Halomicrobium mukohataei TaxID=57705 RepID=C7NXA3_HALMD|nr:MULTISPECIES: DUF4187 domain-containing protein [Halomicrobium]ACV48337.1 hypothetical protein Hmuk_2224 [Halomicrobium mukohataei DSM 12286]QCD66752.1 DUF4187 domain-containing protein [Halomicrobium mukohataei]QFR21557.1 DUF4187 domain-containing protein [Halomicrobium sp. ZPS1]
MPSEIEYCPFCGARLADEESLDDHCGDAEECANARDRWQSSRPRGSLLASRRQRALGWVVAGAVVLYAFVQASLLLGIIASVVVLAVAHVDWTGLA